MGCCNDKRAQWASRRAFTSTFFAPSNRIQHGVSLTHIASPVTFEYVGPTALSVQGPITRTSYRFSQTGVRLQVDPRDAAYLAGVPNLRRVSK
jgi:hypothetical protein